MRLVSTLFMGAIALIVLLGLWLTGSPPAISIFWDRAEATVMRHDTRQVDDGWGNDQRTDPIVEVVSGSRVRTPIRLLVRDATEERDTLVSRWPVGLTTAVRIAPDGRIAYPSDWRPFMLVPATVATVVLALIGYVLLRPFFDARWRRQGGPAARKNAGGAFRPFALLFGVIFTGTPLFLAYVFWTFGDPPPYSITWPRHAVTVLAADIRRHQVGNGTVAAYLDVTVDAPDGFADGGVPLLGVTYGWVPIPEAEALRQDRYLPGETVRAMQSPNGDLYVVRWRFPDFLALMIIPLALISVPIGLFAFRLAFV
ncbi:hypothetical protein [Oricola sp.]|uniref:hypothetical protein n=1 Tax=Oricola sp. TaxID=1979950 RepID=UPI0025E40564|nr:hypothetical protein [Oricola sp.]MCI5078573.1 hypothetical protein [Oricola sp.]